MKPQEINPQETTRAEAFELWMNAPNPMVTFFKKIDVTNLVHISRKYKWKFNMLLCWCIGRAAGEVKEFYMLPVDGKLYKYERLAVNTIVKNRNGEVSSCDIPYSRNHDLSDYMVIGTSAIIDTEIDGAHAGLFLKLLQRNINEIGRKYLIKR